MNRKHIEIINKRQEELERRLDRSWRPKSGGRVLRGGNIVYDVSSRMGFYPDKSDISKKPHNGRKECHDKTQKVFS